MTAVMKFMETYMPRIMGLAVGYGSLFSLISILTGYAISKVLSLVDDK